MGQIRWRPRGRRVDSNPNFAAVRFCHRSPSCGSHRLRAIASAVNLSSAGSAGKFAGGRLAGRRRGDMICSKFNNRMKSPARQNGSWLPYRRGSAQNPNPCSVRAQRIFMKVLFKGGEHNGDIQNETMKQASHSATRGHPVKRTPQPKGGLHVSRRTGCRGQTLFHCHFE
jgi:hypothetical protein